MGEKMGEPQVGSTGLLVWYLAGLWAVPSRPYFHGDPFFTILMVFSTLSWTPDLFTGFLERHWKWFL